jgi:hypothetical protein
MGGIIAYKILVRNFGRKRARLQGSYIIRGVDVR